MKERRPIIIIRTRATVGGRHVYSSDTVYTCRIDRLLAVGRYCTRARGNEGECAPIPSMCASAYMRKRACTHDRAHARARQGSRLTLLLATLAALIAAAIFLTEATCTLTNASAAAVHVRRQWA